MSMLKCTSIRCLARPKLRSRAPTSRDFKLSIGLAPGAGFSFPQMRAMSSAGGDDDINKPSTTWSTLQSIPKARLVMEDGSVFHGTAFGANCSTSGEVVFTTGMMGYPEALTDPSFKSQIINHTFPMVGNYGVPCRNEVDEYGLPKNFESYKIHAGGMIVSDYSRHHSHWNAASSLGRWLEEEGVPGISGIDTRALTKKIRAQGSMVGQIIHENAEEMSAFDDPNLRNLVEEVSITEPVIYGKGNPLKILALDCGIKYNIIRQLVRRGAEVKLVPWNWDIMSEWDWYDGLFLSNGPGDPATLEESTVAHLRAVLEHENGENVKPKPIFGICLGNQLLGIAAGANTFKLPFGNRGQNQPVMDMQSGQCHITSQNHGFALDGKRLPADWKELFINANDKTNEGIMHTSKPYFTAQFHPEHNNGPTDCEFMFDTFLNAVRNKLSGPVDTLRPGRKVAPPRPVVKKVLVLGSGGLSIGQAGEFDYSGSQAIKALKEEGVQVVLMNPNIASVQTNVDSGTTHQADNVYFVPVNSEFVENVIKREKPDGIVISMGGQTALNVGVEMWNKGILQKHNVQVLGTSIDTIVHTEDRDLFSKKLHEINERIAPSFAVTSVEDAVAAAKSPEIGFPCMIRSAFALGGLGSGICEDEAKLVEMARKAFSGSDQILVEKSMKGWKEVEYEVVRDAEDNCITVCNMENFDPLGVHTGDSIVIAPSQTLSNKEYHMLRQTAINVVRHLGIVGECNIQYALNPHSEEYCIIEVNARLSRSSALASKATGYPLAFVAAKLALGKTLPELENAVTKSTTACFEPSLDYVVTKVPRWDLKKFGARVNREIGSAMKSVGEVMAIGRTFEESMQKALRMVEPSIEGYQPPQDELTDAEIVQELTHATDQRVYAIAQALQSGKMDAAKIHELTKIDMWFLDRLATLSNFDNDVLRATPSIDDMSEDMMRFAKQYGFSDRQIADRLGTSEDVVRSKRKGMGIIPRVKQIDTLAAEYPAQTNYLYNTYHGSEDDIESNSEDTNGALVLGSGAYRIGSSVEFDWCAVSCIRTLRKLGKRSVMINYNPETVSTDYDECDQLFFEELSRERVMDIYDRGGVEGVIVSVGGQIPNNLALPLGEAGVKVLGTSPAMIDNAEDRNKFSQMLDDIGVAQPEWSELRSPEQAKAFAEKVGYPVLVRPSYVLSGAAMNVAYSWDELGPYLTEATTVSQDHPVVITKFMLGAREIEMDAVCKDGKIVACAISEHVENAGIHSGDATLILPPVSTSSFDQFHVKRISEKIAAALNITGPCNIQFLAKGADVSVIECNLRASRSFPFVSKTVGADMIQAATKVMMDADTSQDDMPGLDSCGKRPENFVGIKVAMTSYRRLGGADPLIGVEMASTGEVACFGENREEAFLKSLVATGLKLPRETGSSILVSVQESFSEEFVHSAFKLTELGYKLYATEKTHAYLSKYGVESTKLAFPLDKIEGSDEPNVVDFIKDGKIDMVVNLPTSASEQTENNYLIRRTAVDFDVPMLTNIQLVKLFVDSMAKHKSEPMLGLSTDSLFEYYEKESFSDAWTAPTEFH